LQIDILFDKLIYWIAIGKWRELKKINRIYTISCALPFLSWMGIQDHKPQHVLLVFLFIFTTGQYSIWKWRKHHPQSYRAVCLAGLWLVPFTISLIHKQWLFVSSLCIYSFLTFRIVRGASAVPLAPATPRRTYCWFMRAYKCCLVVGASGYLLFMLELTGFRSLLHLPFFLTEIGARFLSWGLYFGLLGRDIAEVCAERISSVLGYAKAKDREASDRPAGGDALTICALCGEDLPCVELLEGGRTDSKTEKTKKTFRLECEHSFHEYCIRGWTIVGKKDTCPRCGEKVQLASILSSSPWLQQSLIWIQLLDFIRTVFVWNPFLLLIAQLVFFLW